ncbi:MAG: transaldolase [Candidatus Woesearchaeota archaeon]
MNSNNALEQLKQYTIIVADTGDIEAIKKYMPQDATTNPSLILKAAKMPEYQLLFDDAVQYGLRKGNNPEQQVSLALDKLFVNFGVEILKIIPGRVSTEVDARYSFDSDRTILKAKSLIKLYEEAGYKKDRVLIKIAATAEGVAAVSELEKQGIHTNSTLLFSYVQAIAVAKAGGTLISPFVGRIMDWYKKHEQKAVDYVYPGEEDPGVLSVKKIYNLFKKHGYKTEIMGASFRNSGEILALAGCDLLTIGPNFLEELKEMDREVPRILSPETAAVQCDLENMDFSIERFRWEMNQDAMATEKLAEGIRSFYKDAKTLEGMIRHKMFPDS